MKQSGKHETLDAEPNDVDLLGQIDRLIATAEARIERQHKYVRSVPRTSKRA
jgi:hypothetical protein